MAKKKTTKAKKTAPAVSAASACACSRGPCYCSAVLALLVIIFTWMSGAWTHWAITIAAAILLLLNLTGVCCCMGRH
ncbi:hypothetical protein JW968_02270 [Candidatus Woesearchaeota archaeon]|nr:hypothetical protein [Candidatus Woesearchaeota archaeon]